MLLLSLIIIYTFFWLSNISLVLKNVCLFKQMDRFGKG